MESKLKKKFIEYLTLVSVKFKKRTDNILRKGTLKLFPNQSYLIREFVDEIEKTKTFNNLVLCSAKNLHYEYHVKTHGESRSSDITKNIISWWKNSISNYFRNKIYLSLFYQKDIDTDNIFNEYCGSFTPRKIKKTIFAPIEFIEFSSTEIQFSNYRICKYSLKELNSIFKPKNYTIFYPWGVFDTELVKDYWWLVLQTEIELPKVGNIYLEPELNKYLNQLRYTDYPYEIDDILPCLILFDWERLTSYWNGFNIPFVIRKINSPFYSPKKSPDMKKLKTEPNTFPGDDGEFIEIGEKPIIGITLDPEQEQRLKKTSEFISKSLQKLKKINMEVDFLEIALMSAIKAFFKDDIEQLIWHTIALESLFVSKTFSDIGICEQLRARISKTLARTNKTQKNIAKDIRSIYDCRSDLVHGRRHKGKFDKNMFFARKYARDSIIWYLKLINYISENVITKMRKNKKITKDEILYLIDMNCDTHDFILATAKNLPDDFPYLPTK